MVSTEIDFRTEGARVAGEEEIRRRKGMPIDAFMRAYPGFRWSWVRWRNVLVDSEGRVWKLLLSEDGLPYDFESTPEEDEDDMRAVLASAGEERIPAEQVDREFAVGGGASP